MHFGIIDQIQCHEKIGNIKLICLKMLVVAVWIDVCVSVKISKDLDEKLQNASCLKMEFVVKLAKIEQVKIPLNHPKMLCFGRTFFCQNTFKL